MEFEHSGIWKLLLLVCVLVIEVSLQEPVEYCQSEHFEASCPEGSIILMRTAEYGRMNYGRCITSNYGNDCSVNVIFYFDQKCSGRQSCKVYVGDPVLHKMQPCSKDLNTYLEASYECIPVATSNLDECSIYHELPVMSPTGFISSQVTVNNNPVGTQACPWVVEVPPGQTIKLTLYTFGKGKMSDISDINELDLSNPSQPCYELGMISEESRSAPFSPCGDSSSRERVVYQSHSNRLRITLLEGVSLQELWPFLIKYEAMGCQNLVPPRGAYVEGDSVTAMVKCNYSGEIWYLTCGEKGWIGDFKNCSKGAQYNPLDDPGYLDCSQYGFYCAVAKTATKSATNFLNMNKGDFPIGILLIVALGVALGVFLGGILLTFVSLHMKKKQKKYNQAHTDDMYNTFQSYQDGSTPKAAHSHHHHHKISLSPHQPYYDIDGTGLTLQGDYGFHTDCPAHGSSNILTNATITAGGNCGGSGGMQTADLIPITPSGGGVGGINNNNNGGGGGNGGHLVHEHDIIRDCVGNANMTQYEPTSARPLSRQSHLYEKTAANRLIT